MVAVNAERDELAPFETALLAAAGIEESDVELIREPVRVERLVAATPMFSNPAYVHPEILQTWSSRWPTQRAGTRPRLPGTRLLLASRADRTWRIQWGPT